MKIQGAALSVMRIPAHGALGTRVLMWVAVLLLSVRTPAGAQETASPSTAPILQSKRGDTVDLRTLLLGLEPGTAVRTSSGAGAFVEGDLLHVGATDILIGVAPLDDVVVGVDDIETLWLISGRRSMIGARWGMLIGGVTGAVFLARAAVNDGSAGAGVGLLVGACGGAVAGGSVGLIIGSLVPVWEPAFRRE